MDDADKLEKRYLPIQNIHLRAVYLWARGKNQIFIRFIEKINAMFLISANFTTWHELYFLERR